MRYKEQIVISYLEDLQLPFPSRIIWYGSLDFHFALRVSAVLYTSFERLVSISKQHNFW
jgi:hypothetical protein